MVLARILNDLISRDSSHISFGMSVLTASQPLQLNQCTSYVPMIVYFVGYIYSRYVTYQVGFVLLLVTVYRTQHRNKHQTINYCCVTTTLAHFDRVEQVIAY